MPLDEASLARIAPYVSSPAQDVFAISGLPEEVVAVVFAHAASSGEGVREGLARMLGDGVLDIGLDPGGASRTASERANAFHRSWVDHAGEDAIGEHVEMHVVVENVSLLVARAIQDHRLGAFAERSLRYAAVRRDAFVDLPELGAANGDYRAAVDKLLATHEALFPTTYAAIFARLTREPGASDADHAERARLATADALRALLPAGFRTTVAISCNARALAGLATKLLSHPLAEARRVGASILDVARGVAPRLFSKVAASAHRTSLAAEVEGVLRTIYTPAEEGANATMVVSQPVRLVRHDKDALERVALALAYDGGDAGAHALGLVEGLRQATPSELAGMLRASVRVRGAADPLPRAFEATSFTFELMIDFGTYRELATHRMLTPAAQRISCRLGFDAPHVITEQALIERFHDAMLTAHDVFSRIDSAHPWEAQYVVPLGFRVRALWTLNARELVHVMERRSSRAAPASCRRIAHGLFRTSSSAHPWLKEIARVDLG